jgi:hypothetical protein
VTLRVSSVTSVGKAILPTVTTYIPPPFIISDRSSVV